MSHAPGQSFRDKWLKSPIPQKKKKENKSLDEYETEKTDEKAD